MDQINVVRHQEFLDSFIDFELPIDDETLYNDAESLKIASITKSPTLIPVQVSQVSRCARDLGLSWGIYIPTLSDLRAWESSKWDGVAEPAKQNLEMAWPVKPTTSLARLALRGDRDTEDSNMTVSEFCNTVLLRQDPSRKLIGYITSGVYLYYKKSSASGLGFIRAEAWKTLLFHTSKVDYFRTAFAKNQHLPCLVRGPTSDTYTPMWIQVKKL